MSFFIPYFIGLYLGFNIGYDTGKFNSYENKNILNKKYYSIENNYKNYQMDYRLNK